MMFAHALFILVFSQFISSRLIEFQPEVLKLHLDESADVEVQWNSATNETFKVDFAYSDLNEQPLPEDELPIEAIPPMTIDPTNSTDGITHTITVVAQKPGQMFLSVNSTRFVHEDDTIIYFGFCKISILRFKWLDILQAIVGWTYFVAWTLSFYPQILLNYRRKSVVGLNFDFLCFNIAGFATYSAFNAGLYWVPYIQDQYRARHPIGIIPVRLNDVVFSLHAFAACLLTAVQVCIYERGSQRVSKTCLVILGLCGAYTIVCAGLGIGNIFTWLDFLYYVSYIKLLVTVIKYIPQAVMNFRRRSTVGWSIGNILLDFTGGLLSLVQMFMLAYNFDDWDSIIASPIKFGIGLVSILFDILFIVQHYCLYRDSWSSKSSARSVDLVDDHGKNISNTGDNGAGDQSAVVVLIGSKKLEDC